MHADPVTLVTGASAGIGRELARVAASRGRDVVLVARRQERLRELADELASAHGVRAEVVAADLSELESPAGILEELRNGGMVVDVLVNNAGFGTFGPFADTETRQTLDLLQVNVHALTHLSALVLPGMVERGHGRILNVASTAGFQPGPLMATYYASKAYVLHLSEALAQELAGTGVTVTALCPGPVATEFQSTASMEDSGLLALPLSGAEEVAARGWRAMERGRRICIPGLVNRLGVWSVRLAPRSLVTRVVLRIQKERGH